MALDFKKIKINEPTEIMQKDFVQAGGDFPPENPSLDQSSQVLTTEPEPTHFDALINNAPIEAVGDNALIMKPDEFHTLFCTAFNTGSAISKLESLKVDSSDGSVLACTQAIHEMCLEIPAMRFLIQPQGKWGTRILAIGAFAVPMAIAVSAEVKQKRATAQPVTGTSQSNAVNVADLQF